MHKIPISVPSFCGNEKKYVNDCMESGWISSAGKYVQLFEEKFAEFCEVKHAIACCNGTTALHLALLALDLKAGDEVIVPTLTYIATANAVSYCGAVPVFVDSESETWNLDPVEVLAKITPRTKGIIAVHLYGHPAKMGLLREIANHHNLFLLEDAAEAHGALYQGQKVGSIGDMAAFSFYANKIISTGEGGMVVTNDDSLAQQARLLRGQGVDPNRRYWHPIIGYNYRMMNLPAAIGLAQVEQVETLIEKREKLAEIYHNELGSVKNISWQSQQPWAKHVYWMMNVILEGDKWKTRDEIMKVLDEKGIETRPVFYPVHSLPPYLKSCSDESFPIAEHLARNGISLPTWIGLKDTDIKFICESLQECQK